MHPTKYFLATGAAAFLSAASLNAAPFVSDNFDSYDPAVGLTSPWEVYGSKTSTTVSGVTVTAAGQSSLGSGTYGLCVFDNEATSANPKLQIPFTAYSGSPKLAWSFDYRADPDTTTSNLVFRLTDGTSGSQASTGPLLLIDRAANKLQGRNGTTITDIANITDGQWYRVVVTIDVPARKFDVAIKGGTEYPALTTVKTNWGFYGSPTSLNTMTLTDNNQAAAGSKVYLDNVSLDLVPEPAAASLGSIALAALIFRRRERRD